MTKKILFLILGGLIFCSTFLSLDFLNFLESTSQDLSLNESRVSKWISKHEPNDFFGAMRSYPNEYFDFKAYRKVLIEAKLKSENDKLLKKNGQEVVWRQEGPLNIGGRINFVVSEPENSDVIYAGISKGGVFKTIDGGLTWNPIFDDQLFLSIGHIAIDPSDSQTIYVGTGDVNISGHFTNGDGLYRSKDGGDTWEHLGLEEHRVISRVIVHPENPNILFVASMGDPRLGGTTRGLYKSTDGGLNWAQKLYVSDTAGIIDLRMHIENPDILYAAGWDRIRTTQTSQTVGQGAKVYKSIDGGDNWEILQGNLPEEDMSRIGLELSQQNPESLLAVYVSPSHELHNLYRSDDSGESWDTIASPGLNGMSSSPLGGFGWYFAKVVMNPYNDNEIYLLGVDMYRTTDNGDSWEDVTPFDVHADKHSLHFLDSTTAVLATDGGLYKTIDNGDTWTVLGQMPISQFYRVAYNPHNPGEYAGGLQDNGTCIGGVENINEWIRIFGGDGFQVAFHPTDSLIFYVEIQRGQISVTTNGGLSFSGANNGYDFSDRTNWDTPYFISHHNPDVLYRGSYRMYRNETGADVNWVPISEDLTDGNIFGSAFHTISYISESPISPSILYVGTSDGNVWRSLDTGETWEQINEGLPDRYITSIHPSPNQENTVYLTSSGFKGVGYESHIFKSIDNGDNWEEIHGDLPSFGVNDIMVYPNEPTEQILFCATDIGVYFTENGGENWIRLGSNMPSVLVNELEYDPSSNRLLAATFARSLMTFPIDSIIIDEPISGINLINSNFEKLEMYPNPASDFLKSKTELPQNVKWSIYAISGQDFTSYVNLELNQKFNISTLPQGDYVLIGEPTINEYSKEIGFKFRFQKKN